MNNAAQLTEEGGPLVMESAEGIYVTAMDGKKYIDGISGMYFRNVGHGREEIARAVYEQLSTISMNVYAGATPATIELAVKLAEITPGDLTRTFFCQGGTRLLTFFKRNSHQINNLRFNRGKKLDTVCYT